MERFTVAKISNALVELVGFADLQRVTLPIGILPADVAPGQILSFEIHRDAGAESLRVERILKLQDDIAVHFRSQVKQPISPG